MRTPKTSRHVAGPGRVLTLASPTHSALIEKGLNLQLCGYGEIFSLSLLLVQLERLSSSHQQFILTSSYVNSTVSHNEKELTESCSITFPPFLAFDILLWSWILVWNSAVMRVDSELGVSQKVTA